MVPKKQDHNDCVDLSKTNLVVEGKVVKANGANLDGNEQASIAPGNNFLHSSFKQVDVYLNVKQVTPAIGTYPYRAYFETLLNYDVSAKESRLTSALYYEHTPGEMDNAGSLPTEKTITVLGTGHKVMVPGSGNQGFAKRHQFIRDGKLLTMEGPLFVDAFMSNRLLLDKVDIKLILNRSSDQFCLIDKNTNPINAQVKLTDVILKVCKVKVSQQVQAAHALVLKHMPALYPICRVECKAFVVGGNVLSIRI